VTLPVRTRHSFAEYLELEARSDVKHEFLDGQIFAMSGGTPEHGRLAAQIIGILHGQLQGRSCVTFTSDVRIRVHATGLATYPDVSVFCGDIERDSEDQNSVTNPTVLVEVLSSSTEAYDREEKFAHYRLIPSLRAYVLVSQEEPRIEVFTRVDETTWTLRDFRKGTAPIEPIGCELALDALYANRLGT
jgi:Uma2 family endonuclease